VTAGTGLSGGGSSGGVTLNVDAAQGHVTSLGTQAADFKVGDGYGLVVGHSAQVTVGGNEAELQVLGTTTADSQILIGNWQENPAFKPQLNFIRSGHASIGSFAILTDNEVLGSIGFHYDDDVDYAGLGVNILAEVDDASPAESAIGGALVIQTAATDGSVIEAARWTSSQNYEQTNGMMLIGDTANDNMTVGLTINQGANDNNILTLKSSDIDHGLTSYGFLGTEIDDYYNIRKKSATIGGVQIQATATTAAGIVYDVLAAGGTPDTTKSTAGVGTFTFTGMEHTGSNGRSNATSTDGNLVAIRGYTGSAFSTAWLATVAGDTWQSGSMTLGGTTTSTSTSTGSIVTAGGVGIAENLWVGGQANFSNSAFSVGTGNAEGHYEVTNTQGVTSSAVEIARGDSSTTAGLVQVYGVKNDDNGEQFYGLVALTSNGHTVIVDMTSRGSPAARTYSSTSSQQLKLSVAANTWDVTTHYMMLTNPQ